MRLKPNLLELAELTGETITDENDILETGRSLAKRIAVVLITAGHRGAYCFADDAVWHARVDVAENRIRSTVGCGDALLAGFLARRVRDDVPVEEALRHAVAVAGASAMNERPAFFDLADAESLKSSTTLRRVV